jgi:hypothetical protein
MFWFSKKAIPFFLIVSNIQLTNMVSLIKKSKMNCKNFQWVETNASNIRKQTSIFIASWYYDNG